MALKVVYLADALTTLGLGMIKLLAHSQKSPKVFKWACSIVRMCFDPMVKMYLNGQQTKYQIEGMSIHSSSDEFANPFRISPAKEIVSTILEITAVALDTDVNQTVKDTAYELIAPFMSTSMSTTVEVLEEYSSITIKKTTRHLVANVALKDDSVVKNIVFLYQQVFMGITPKPDIIEVSPKSTADASELFLM
jgi:hypothetical protein